MPPGSWPRRRAGRWTCPPPARSELAGLFRLEVVGAEDVGQEVGSNLATVTSIAALNTSARVLRSQGPRVLRGPIGLLGASSSFAWRVTKRGWGINLHTALVVTIVGPGLVGLVGSFVGLLTDIDIGAWSYVAVACLVLTPVLAMFAAPWLLLGVGRRRMSRMGNPGCRSPWMRRSRRAVPHAEASTPGQAHCGGASLPRRGDRAAHPQAG